MLALVTGANGHLGFNLVAALRARGHRVRAGVRSVANPVKTARLRALEGVDLVDADLAQPEQLRAAMDGVEVLFQVAAVYAMVPDGRGDEIVAASHAGGKTALCAAADARVRKIVFTSSTVTLPLVASSDERVDESQWASDLRVPYVRAKTEGERLAWETAGRLGLNMVSILPSGITGPGFERNTPTIDFFEAIMRGAMRIAVPDTTFPVVDVRDVAAAHILAAENDCEGRFIASGDECPRFRDLVELAHSIDPSVGRSLMDFPRFMGWSLPLFDRLNHWMLGSPRIATSDMVHTFSGLMSRPSNRRIRQVLGWQPQFTLEQTVRETMQAIRVRRT